MSPYQPGEQSSYAAPQDPWADVQGSAAPTSPIAAVPAQPGPLPQRVPYTPGIATPTTPTPSGPPGIWSQETIASGDRYTTPRQGGGAGVYVLVALLVVVLGGAGGYGAWYLTKQRVSPTGTTDGNSTQAQTSSSPGLLASCPDGLSGFDGCQVRVDDCLSITGDRTNPDVANVSCTAEGAQKVLKVIGGTDIDSGGLHALDKPYLDGLFGKHCAGLAGAGYYFAWKYPTNAGGDRFYCLSAPRHLAATAS